MNKDDKMLWIGDLQEDMDADFVAEAFKLMGETTTGVKIVPDKSGQKTAYGFVEFEDGETARRCMLTINGKPLPNAREANPPLKFNMSFANSPSVPSTEYNLFVNNIPQELDDAALFLVFGERYISCRGAKVYRDASGESRGAGFVRFADQTDQQRALVEMNKHMVAGMPIALKLAQPKHRGPRNQTTIVRVRACERVHATFQGDPVPAYFPSPNNVYGQQQQQVFQPTIIYAPPQQTVLLAAPSVQHGWAGMGTGPPPGVQQQQQPPAPAQYGTYGAAAPPPDFGYNKPYQQNRGGGGGYRGDDDRFMSFARDTRERRRGGRGGHDSDSDDDDRHRHSSYSRNRDSRDSRSSSSRYKRTSSSRSGRQSYGSSRRGHSQSPPSSHRDRPHASSASGSAVGESLMDYIQALVYDSDPDAQGIADELQPEQHYNGTIGDKLMYNRRYVMQSEGLLRAVDASRYNHLLVNATVTLNDIVGLADTSAAVSTDADVTGGGDDAAAVQLMATA